MNSPTVLGVYFMKDKQEILAIFMAFFNEIKSQFQILIKVFKSDNAKKYFSVQLSSLSLIGYFTSCPHSTTK